MTFLCLPLAAQVIRYDTIQVAPDDERNIHAAKREYYRREKPIQVKAKSEPMDISSVKNSTFDPRKLRFGANLGLSLSRNYSVFMVGLPVGYKFSDKLMAGAGARYYSLKSKGYNESENYTYRNQFLGTNLFGYAYPLPFIAFFIQPEINYMWQTMNVDADINTYRGWVPAVVVGGGFRLGGLHITLNYDLVRHTDSPYPQGFFWGFSTFF